MNRLAVVKLTASRLGLLLDKASPQLWLGVGLAGNIAGTILASLASTKVEDRIKAFKRERDDILTADYSAPFTEKDRQKDLVRAYVTLMITLTKLYGPAVALTLAGSSCIIGSNRIMADRNAALMTAYKIVNEGFQEYRQRIIKKFGPDADKEIRSEALLGPKGDAALLDEVTKKGNDALLKSDFSRVFCERLPDGRRNQQWSTDGVHNQFYVESCEKFANDTLYSRGHFFLNEAYDSLGFDRTQLGSICGWVYNSSSEKPISFGLDTKLNNVGKTKVDRGGNAPIYLNFNVQGIIWDLI